MPLPVAFNNLAANPMAAPYHAPYYYDNNDPATYSGQGYSAGVEWDSELPAESDFDWDSMIEDQNDIIDFDNEESRPANNVGAVRRLTQIAVGGRHQSPSPLPGGSGSNSQGGSGSNSQGGSGSNSQGGSDSILLFTFPSFTVGTMTMIYDDWFVNQVHIRVLSKIAADRQRTVVYEVQMNIPGEQYSDISFGTGASSNIIISTLEKAYRYLKKDSPIYIPISISEELNYRQYETWLNYWATSWQQADVNLRLDLAKHIIVSAYENTYTNPSSSTGPTKGRRRLRGIPA